MQLESSSAMSRTFARTGRTLHFLTTARAAPRLPASGQQAASSARRSPPPAQKVHRGELLLTIATSFVVTAQMMNRRHGIVRWIAMDRQKASGTGAQGWPEPAQFVKPVDIGKNMFHVVGLDSDGEPVQRVRYRRDALMESSSGQRRHAAGGRGGTVPLRVRPGARRESAGLARPVGAAG